LRRPRAAEGSINDAIDAVVNAEVSGSDVAFGDEYDNWRKYEPRWTREHYDSDSVESVVEYWLRLKPQYPYLAQLALDVLLIPASSCDCERVMVKIASIQGSRRLTFCSAPEHIFSELGDLLEPRRCKIGAELLAGAQAGVYTYDEIESKYTVDSWEHVGG
jgi:hypothetical protein